MAIRVYADTSVFGGILDAEFAVASNRFVELVVGGAVTLVTSALVALEIDGAPHSVRANYERLRALAEVLPAGPEPLVLREAFVAAGLVRARSRADALHVALAVVGECDAIVSWNFRDIVRYDLIPRYNSISVRLGYRAIAIHTPPEVVSAFEDLQGR